MRIKFLVLVTLVLALLGATALAWHQYRELIELRSQLLGNGDRAALEARLQALAKRNVELEAKLAATRGAAGDTAATTEAEHEGDVEKTADASLLAKVASLDGITFDGGSKADAEFEVLAALADLPEFQKLMALQQRGKIDSKYAALFRKLHLSPEQQQQMERLLGDKQSAFADAMIAAHDQGLTGRHARNLANTVARATQKEIDESIKQLLGQQVYKQYQNYERTLPQRETVDRLAQRLSYTGTPLSSRQQEQLVQTLANAARQPAANAGAPAGANGVKPPHAATVVAPLPGPLSGLGTSTTAAVITPPAISKAQTFLSPQQLTALQQLQQEQQAQQTLSQLLRAKGVKPNGKPAKPGKG